MCQTPPACRAAIASARRMFMIAVTEDLPQRVLLSNISWDTYEALLRDIDARHIRLTYDEGDLEIMTISFGHENAGEWIGRLLFFLAFEMKVAVCSGGSTTLKNYLRRKGLEPDKCFWLKNERRMRGKKQWDALTDPPPDLAIEVDITSSSLDRRAIYAALGVPELWHYDGAAFRVLILDATGKYKEKSRSLAFPSLPLRAFARYVKKLGATDEVSLIQEFVDWVRAEVAEKKGNPAGRKNGRRNS
jgi:Uma2 family endonuclease